MVQQDNYNYAERTPNIGGLELTMPEITMIQRRGLRRYSHWDFVDDATIEDVCQEGLVRYLKATNEGKHADHPNHEALLVFITQRVYLESVNGSVREKKRKEKFAGTGLFSRDYLAERKGAQPAEHYLELEERERRIRQALKEAREELTPPHQAVYDLVVGGTTRIAAAEKLGIPRTTYDTRLRVVRAKIGELLESAGLEAPTSIKERIKNKL